MGHSHSHSHDSRAANRSALRRTLVLTTGFAAAEVVGGIVTGSLALLADAGHMVSDSASIALALGAMWLASRPSTPRWSFGLRRAEILAAFVNGLTLIGISVWIWLEAYDRLSDPPEILGGWMMAVAALGLVVNLAAAGMLWRGQSESLNVSAAFRHVLADLLGSVGVIVAAAIILLTGWREADPLISALIGLLIVGSAWGILRDSLVILLEGTPQELDSQNVAGEILKVEGVVQVHDLHIWTITSGFPALSAHVLVRQEDDCHERRSAIETVLTERFGIKHSTLQMDHQPESRLISAEELRGGASR